MQINAYREMVEGLAPHPNAELQRDFWLVMLLRYITKKPHVLEQFYRSRLNAQAQSAEPLTAQLKAHMSSAKERDIPRIKAADVTPETFQSLFKFPFPLVIENFAAESEAVQRWSPEYFREKHGKVEIPFFRGKDYRTLEKGSVAELIDDILSGGRDRRYVNNIADIFYTIPELQAALPIEKLERFMGNRKHNKTQIFLGGAETGTGLHCANKFNLFIMIYGQKKWTFLHPKHSPWLYPTAQKNFQFVYAPISDKFSFDAERYPGIMQVPRYTTVLNPGDVLVNPPWWWHAVENLSPASIGVATRWMTPWESIDGWKTNPLFSALEKLSLHYWKFAIKYYLLGICRRDSDGRLSH